ncbi:MAG TPA: hypothetical protein VEP90_04830 [Methylomirabilota bacterium]|nr:hypothetical protein [Methylomirabilota bacterium]
MSGPGNGRRHPKRVIPRYSAEEYRLNAEAIKKIYDPALDFYESLEQDYETMRNDLSRKETELQVLNEKTKAKWVPYLVQCFCSVAGTALLAYGVNVITSCMFSPCKSDLGGLIPTIFGVVFLLVSLFIPPLTNLGGSK